MAAAPKSEDSLLQELFTACEKHNDFLNLSAPTRENIEISDDPSALVKLEAKRLKNSTFVELIKWSEIEGKDNYQKAQKVLAGLQKIASALETKIEFILECKAAAQHISGYVNLTSESTKNAEEDQKSQHVKPEATIESTSFLSAALKRYHSLVSRLGITTAEQSDHIDPHTIEQVYTKHGTYRSIGPNNVEFRGHISSELLKSLSDSAIESGIIFDLLQLASGGRLTPIPTRREVAELVTQTKTDDTFVDQEREVNKFFGLINWNRVDGASAISKVFNFLKAAEEVRTSGDRKLAIQYNENFGELIASHIRGKKLAALDVGAHFNTEDSISKDPESLLRRNFALRGTFRTFAAVGSPYLSTYTAEYIMSNSKVTMTDRVMLCDVWNLVNGGEIVTKSLWYKFLANRFEQQNKSKEELKAEVSRNEQVIELLKKIDWKELPGENSRAKCISALMLLGKIAGRSDGININLSEDNLVRSSAKDTAKQINDSVKTAKQLTESESKLLVEALRSGNNGAASGSGHFELTSRVIAAEMLSSPLMRQVGRIAQVLRATSHFGPVRAAPAPKKFNQWHEVLELDELSQLRDALPAELAQAAELPDLFLVKFLSSPPQGLREPQLRSTKQIGADTQLLYLLVDCSGSMNVPERIGTAVALLTNRLMAVTRGEASLFYRFFDSSAHEQVAATNREQAASALATVMKGHYSGGGTSIDTAIRSGVSSIQSILSKDPMIKPELYVVSDGEDSVRISLQELQGIRLHVFLVAGQKNENLEKLALSSGGMVMRVGANGEVLQIREHL